MNSVYNFHRKILLTNLYYKKPHTAFYNIDSLVRSLVGFQLR